MAPKAKALTATPTCELRGIIRGAIYELWRSFLAYTEFREEDFPGRVEDANLKLVSPRSTKIVAILLSSSLNTFECQNAKAHTELWLAEGYLD